MGTSKKQKKRGWLRYRDFVLSPYGVIKIKSLGYTLRSSCGYEKNVDRLAQFDCQLRLIARRHYFDNN
ncbi:hypothetical protein [Symbiopectobacterium sp. RP]|uniref:hypothetical protein n=1 Tax=Symbiopectobacterium sp. RP TaxID=3248553 RepID=UPI003D2C6205